MIFIIIVATVVNYWISVFSDEQFNVRSKRIAVDNSITQYSIRTGKPFYVFMHVPKTGGTYIAYILSKWCEATRRKCSKSLEAFFRLNKTEQNQIDLLYAHLPYGIHKTNHFYINPNRPIKYFTMLRNPVRHAVSAFHFDRWQLHPLAGAFALESAVNVLNESLYVSLEKKH